MGKAITPAKTQAAGKRGGKRSTSWRKGQSGNPKGAPKRGESWAELISKVGDMTPAEAAQYCAGELAAQLRKADAGVTMKTAVVMRVYAALLFEPTPGMLNAFMDRVEGTPKQSFEVTGDSDKPLTFKVVETSDIRAAIGVAVAAGRSAGNLRTSSED